VCILAIVFPGLLFLTTKPDLNQYSGLSALATGGHRVFLSLSSLSDLQGQKVMDGYICPVGCEDID
jgi:hypothetical protein